MPFKTTALAFIASLAAHALVVASLDPSFWENKDISDRLVDISYVRYKEDVPNYQQLKYPPVVRNPSKVKKPQIEAQVLEQHREISPLKTQPLPAAPVLAPISLPRTGSSEELVSDPHKGKVFLNYFGLIKQRVRRVVERKYPGEQMEHGDVSLMFVLKSDGTLVNVSAVEKDSSADEVMKDFAIRCVKECAPFPHFPKELDMERISFNLSILFDES